MLFHEDSISFVKYRIAGQQVRMLGVADSFSEEPGRTLPKKSFKSKHNVRLRLSAILVSLLTL
jgi:hypothetical protein